MGLRVIQCRTALRAVCSRAKFGVLLVWSSLKYFYKMLCHHIWFTSWLIGVTREGKLTWRKALKVRWNHLLSTHRDVAAFLEIDHTYSIYSETGELLLK